MDPINDLGMVDGHQANRRFEHRIRPGRTDQSVTERAAVERLVFGSDRDQKVVGLEVLGRHPAQPQREVWQACQ